MKITFEGEELKDPEKKTAAARLGKQIKRNGILATEEKVRNYPKLEAENTELKRKCEKFESENQELKTENALQQQLVKSQNETIDALKRENDANQTIIKLLTKEHYRDEEKEHSKSCLGFE